jgi:peptidoglycan/xylan/chitin deacetylase (PgdA/CDA1 family)
MKRNFNKEKKVFLIWDFDGPIGQINSTLPYNYNFENLNAEISNVKWLLEFLKQNKIKCCFAITGFSAEIGVYPYCLSDLIKEIFNDGHEIASHSWRHEWIPIFSESQIDKSLKRSKKALELVTSKNNIIGFVPPHNRPMTWLQKGAFSIGDRGIYPFFKMANLESLIPLLKKNNYKWVRITYKNLFTKFIQRKQNITGKIYHYNDILILENHYNGFDEHVINHILESNYDTFTVSAHPLMLSFDNKKESKKEFINFIEKLSNSGQKIIFQTPLNYLNINVSNN